MKVRIYAPHINNPEFIRFQLASIKAHVKDDWEYIVVNDAINEPFINNFLESNMRLTITATCKELGVQCLEFPQELHKQRDKIFPALQFFGNNPSTRASDVYQWTLQSSLDFEGYVVILDGDMFFIQDVSLLGKMGSKHIAFVPQVRGGIEYPWLNLVGFYPKLTPNIQDFSYDTGSVNGVALDSGGLCYHYLQANKETLLIRYISYTFLNVSERTACDIQELATKTGMDCILPYAEYPSDQERFTAFEYLDDCILHYGGGSNWHSDPVLFHRVKTKTMLEAFGQAIFFPTNNLV
jgi:hypothetical protein